MDTYFAPAQRTERRKFRNQIISISDNPVMDTVLKTAAGLLVVLNEDRQIVALNHAFLKEIGVQNYDEALGLRLGESLGCVHAFEAPNGCGTTEYCQSCGAAIATVSAMTQDQVSEQTCVLDAKKNGRIVNTCLLIRAHPIWLDKNRWILIYAQDVTQQQFWINLERVFFHDINNTLTALYGNAQLLEMDQPDNKGLTPIREGIERLINEVQMQKTFSQRKSADFHLAKIDVSLQDIKKEVHLIISGHRSAYRKKIIEQWPEQVITLSTDILLTSRILGNMIINAFEATSTNEAISLTTRVTSDFIIWEVWNKTYIPPEIQKRVFQKHFSTKSDQGRGLGTYSMKLLGETYLKGKIFFSSSKADGTCFNFHLPR